MDANGALVKLYWQGKTELLGEKPVSVTLSTTNITWTGPGSNPDLRSESPAADLLRHGTAFVQISTLSRLLHVHPTQDHLFAYHNTAAK